MVNTHVFHLLILRPCVFVAFDKHELKVLCFSRGIVHELVKRCGGRLGRVRKMSILKAEDEGMRNKMVSKNDSSLNKMIIH